MAAKRQELTLGVKGLEGEMAVLREEAKRKLRAALVLQKCTRALLSKRKNERHEKQSEESQKWIARSFRRHRQKKR